MVQMENIEIRSREPNRRLPMKVPRIGAGAQRRRALARLCSRARRLLSGTLLHVPVFLILFLFCTGCGRRREVMIETIPAGGAVWVDGRPAGAAPVSIPTPKKKSVTVRVTHPGYRAWEHLLAPDTVPSGGVLRVTLEPRKKHTLVLQSNPEGAQVFVDGEFRGRTPLRLRDVDAETCRLTFRMDGYASVHRDIDLDAVAGDTVRVLVPLLDLREAYYRKQIQEQPDNLALYADLAHEYAIKHRFGKVAAILEQGVVRALRTPGASRTDPARRLWAEIDRIQTRQFDYGDDEAVRKARKALEPVLKRLLDRFPDGSPMLYAEYALCRALQGQSEDAKRVMREAFRRFPGQRRILERLGNRIRSRRLFP